MDWKPLQTYVLIERLPVEEKTKSGIIIPNVAQSRRSIGTIIDMSASLTDVSVKLGDLVLFGDYSGHDIEIPTDNGTKEVTLVKYADLLMIAKISDG